MKLLNIFLQINSLLLIQNWLFIQFNWWYFDDNYTIGNLKKSVSLLLSQIISAQICWNISHHILTLLSPYLRKSSILYTCTVAHTRLMALFLWLSGWACTRKEKPIWILLKQETASGSGIRWAICKSAPCSCQITTPVWLNTISFRPERLLRCSGLKMLFLLAHPVVYCWLHAHANSVTK